MIELTQKVNDAYTKTFGKSADIVAVAPGRVNIIGEHVDYTGGFVLPVAIDREIIFAASQNDTDEIKGYSVDFDEQVSFKAGEYDPKHSCGWARYIMGVLSELEKDGYTIKGFNFAVGGNVPLGSGLSSSAALELSVCTAAQSLFDFELSGKDAALLCQRAENNFVGMNCGIMDQYISSVGKKDHAVKIDCLDLSADAIPVNTPGYQWVVIDSKKSRGLVDSEYNDRRRECEEGLEAAKKLLPQKNVESLRDVTEEDLPIFEKECSEKVYKRVKHTITENARTMNTVGALADGNIKAVGEYLYASHASLKDDFEVSCIELDTIVDAISKVSGAAGARLTGAGFGGCVIALVKEESINELGPAIASERENAGLPKDITPEVWPIKISDGARILSGSPAAVAN